MSVLTRPLLIKPSDSRPRTDYLLPEQDTRVQRRGSPGRSITGEPTNDGQEQRNAREAHRICRAHFVELTPGDARHGEGPHEADADAPAVIIIPWRTISRTISRCSAPMAIRRPISRVR